MTRDTIQRTLARNGTPRLVLTNLAARVVALVAVAVATLLVARTSGPVWVGAFALLRILPPIAGFLAAGGLPIAAPYFLAGKHGADRRLRPTLLALMVIGGVAGAAGWLALSPLLGRTLLPELGLGLVALAAVLVVAQMLVSSFKAFCQGDHDLPGSNLIIVLEELSFLPAFGALWAVGLRDGSLVILALLAADVCTASVGGVRLLRNGFLRDRERVDLGLARDVWRFGMLGEMGSVMLLVNLRLDFAVVDLVAGPAALGIYAVASKYAELLRLPSDAVLWVAYPRFAGGRQEASASQARTAMRRAGILVALAAIPLALLSVVVIPVMYGSVFAPAVLPACILLIGLAGEGVAAVAIAYLFGHGVPGKASAGIGAGVVTTVVLDLLLIPRIGIVGAAVASTLAYLTTTVACFLFFSALSRPERVAGRSAGAQGARS
jgi:O-antigen/teichoic acid export membrane protein